jgi:hypothetical protein
MCRGHEICGGTGVIGIRECRRGRSLIARKRSGAHMVSSRRRLRSASVAVSKWLSRNDSGRVATMATASINQIRCAATIQSSYNTRIQTRFCYTFSKTTNNIGEVKAKSYNIDNPIIDEFTGQARSGRRSFIRRDSSRTRRGRRREMRECGASERIVRATTPLVFGNRADDQRATIGT